jgi:hypothetical protein
MWVFGGMLHYAFQPQTIYNDLWWLDLTTYQWTYAGVGPAGGGVFGHSAVLDPSRDRMLVFGGKGTLDASKTYALPLDGLHPWSEVIASGVPPPSRLHHSAIFDVVRDRMIVFGGDYGTKHTHAPQ